MSRLLLLLVAALALVAAGCGGGSSSSETTTTETVTESTTTETATSGETTTGETTTEASSGTTGSTFNWASEDCQNLVKAYAGLSAAVGAASSGQDVSGEIADFAKYESKVPAAIRDDVKTLTAAYGTFAKEIAKIGYTPGSVPSADQLQQLADASKPLATAEVQAAGTNLSAWTTKNCTK